MPRKSLSALEILLRQTREDPELNAYPLVRANLMTLIRALQRQGLDQGEEDIAVGRVLNRRHLLLLVPSGALKSSEAMNLVVRIEEQNHKANGALRRRNRMGLSFGSLVKRVPSQRRPVPTAGARYQVDDEV